MAEFIYHVKDQDGKDVRGVQQADDITRLVGLLRDKGFHIISIEPIRSRKKNFYHEFALENFEIAMLGLDLKGSLTECPL